MSYAETQEKESGVIVDRGDDGPRFATTEGEFDRIVLEPCGMDSYWVRGYEIQPSVGIGPYKDRETFCDRIDSPEMIPNSMADLLGLTRLDAHTFDRMLEHRRASGDRTFTDESEDVKLILARISTALIDASKHFDSRLAKALIGFCRDAVETLYCMAEKGEQR